MGMFDSIFVDCPACKKPQALEYQSKSGDCVLGNYSLQNVPSDVLVGHHGYSCKCECGREFDLVVKARKMVVAYECRLVDSKTQEVALVTVAPYRDSRQIETDD